MQQSQHIHTHGHAGNEDALQFFWRNLPSIRGFGNGVEQRRRDEAEIDIGNALDKS